MVLNLVLDHNALKFQPILLSCPTAIFSPCFWDFWLPDLITFYFYFHPQIVLLLPTFHCFFFKYILAKTSTLHILLIAYTSFSLSHLPVNMNLFKFWTLHTYQQPRSWVWLEKITTLMLICLKLNHDHKHRAGS